jgi:hypothetical protein
MNKKKDVTCYVSTKEKKQAKTVKYREVFVEKIRKKVQTVHNMRNINVETTGGSSKIFRFSK